ncbi:2S albumin-like [Olea europaea var. sylvestris]|uniref:2S albumin-like n=1 Tax=Olea europaea var. sylvestris TaxID=158386 RepID=UPI000C1D62A0|nr:2S albumin-like [Olea europaea var. sylvestris]
MVKKIISVGAILLLALMAMDEVLATTVTTTVTTTTIDEEENQQCHREIQTRSFPNCETYLKLEFDRADATIMLPYSKKHYKRRCCRNELSGIDKQCVCFAVRTMMKNMMDSGRLSAEDMEAMLELAGDLPTVCNLRKHPC